MIIQYLSKIVNDDGTKYTFETIQDKVIGITDKKGEVEILQTINGSCVSTVFQKENTQIYQMWLLNDDFKTLKRLF